eukprot:992641-Amphidinium_carterae.4
MQIAKGRTTFRHSRVSIGFGEERMWEIGSFLGGRRKEQRWSQHPFLQATLKEINTRLEQGQPPVKKAPNFTIAMVASLELYVVREPPL